MISQELKSRLAEANATIAVAHRALGEGKIVSLDGLETHVDITCKAIVELPRDEGQALRPAMMALIDGLDQLTKALEQDHGETKSSLNSLSDRERAQSAYSKTEKS